VALKVQDYAKSPETPLSTPPAAAPRLRPPIGPGCKNAVFTLTGVSVRICLGREAPKQSKQVREAPRAPTLFGNAIRAPKGTAKCE
jgi:hypothetical protein